jgi:hypothetical protein
MAAPGLTFSITGNKISAVSGYDSITVAFSSDISYQAFECRATKSGEAWGLGKGTLIASFSQTPANTQRTFEVYDDFLLNGDGEYRISLYAQGVDGSWNDNYGFVPSGTTHTMKTSDGKEFLCMKE